MIVPEDAEGTRERLCPRPGHTQCEHLHRFLARPFWRRRGVVYTSFDQFHGVRYVIARVFISSQCMLDPAPMMVNFYNHQALWALPSLSEKTLGLH